jgi:hypothetical protein
MKVFNVLIRIYLQPEQLDVSQFAASGLVRNNPSDRGNVLETVVCVTHHQTSARL